jgi:hypothetical protein
VSEYWRVINGLKEVGLADVIANMFVVIAPNLVAVTIFETVGKLL